MVSKLPKAFCASYAEAVTLFPIFLAREPEVVTLVAVSEVLGSKCSKDLSSYLH